MRFSMQKVTLLGNIGRDPEIKEVNGSRVCNISVATVDRIKGANGEYTDQTDWHNVSFWGKQADLAHQYLKKGDKVYIEGKLKPKSYMKDGVKTFTINIFGEDFTPLGGKSEAPANKEGDGGSIESSVFDNQDFPF